MDTLIRETLIPSAIADIFDLPLMRGEDAAAPPLAAARADAPLQAAIGEREWASPGGMASSEPQ